MTLRLAKPFCILALCAPILSTQALASAMNEYTMSPSDMNATVTTYQGTYQTEPLQPSYQTQPLQPSYQTQPLQPSYQTQPSYQAESTTPQFGEIVYDTEPYMPNATTTDSYTTQPYSGDTMQPTYTAPASN